MHSTRLRVTLLLLASVAYGRSAGAEGGPFVGLDLGVSEPTNANYRAHVRTGATGSPYVGYMFNKYLGAQGQLHATFQTTDHHSDFPNNRNQTTSLLGGTVGPRLSFPLSSPFGDGEVYGTAQGGVYTGLSGRLNHTAAGFSVGGGIEYYLTPTVAVGLFGRWNRAYMSPRPTDLGPGQVPDERYGEDIQWVTAGVGLRYRFPQEKPAPPPAPPPPLPVAEAPPPPAKRKIVLRNVHFDFDKAEIRADAAPVLDEAAEELKGEGQVSIIAEGHTDSIGTEAYNLKLSLRRAQAVRDYLVAHGMAPDRIRIEGFGETRPVATNDTADGRAQNRRVELHVGE